MSHSKNDIPLGGGTVRVKVHPARNKSDAQVFVINPKTNKPFSYAELIKTLQERAIQYSAYRNQILNIIAELQQRAANNPEKIFYHSYRAKSAEEALKVANKNIPIQIEPLVKILFRPLWEKSASNGIMTISQFVDFLGDDLFLHVSNKDTRTHLMNAMRREILPVMGKEKICDLTSEHLQKFSRQISKNLKKNNRKKTWCSHTQMALKKLVLRIKQFDKAINASPEMLALLVPSQKNRTAAMKNNLAPLHLDDEQRKQLFTELQKPENISVLFWVMLLYAGMRPAEMCAGMFGEIKKLELNKANVYTYLVSKYVRKEKSRYATVNVKGESFDFKYFRQIAIPTWGNRILEEYAEILAKNGRPLETQFFSCTVNGKKIWPDEIEEQIQEVMKKAGIQDVEILSSDTNGQPSQITFEAKTRLLIDDARYVAETRCGADAFIMHSMFGVALTETDEKAYLALYSDEYAVRKAQILRRYSPIPSDEELMKNQLLSIVVENNSDTPQKMAIIADYAVDVDWKVVNENKE